jgi:predicted MFS family arabinose efflux permease
MSSALAPVRYAPFRYLVAGRVVSMAGNALAPIALAFAVLDLTGSVTALGVVVAARSVMTVLFLLFGGVVADRLPRQLVAVASSLLAGAVQLGAAALVLRHTASVPLLAGLGAVNGLAASFAFPALSALVAQTVPAPIRKQANALHRLGVNSAMILGASAGGLLVAAYGPGWGLAVDAATFFVAAGSFALVRIPRLVRAGSGTSTLAELREGWREFVGRTWVWVVVVGFCFLNAALVGAVQVLGPAVADHSIGRRVWGLVLAAQTAGMVVGGVVAMRVRVRRLLLLGMVCAAGDILLLVPLAVFPRAALLLPGAFLGGLAMEQFGIAWETSMQEHVPAEKLARVYSYDALGSFLAIPLGEVAAGPAAKAFGTTAALLCAAGIMGLSVAGTLLSRDVRTLEHRPAGQAEPEPVAVPG